MFGKVRLLTKGFVDLFLPNYCFLCDKPHSNKYECLCDEWWTFLSPDHGNNWIDFRKDYGSANKKYSIPVGLSHSSSYASSGKNVKEDLTNLSKLQEGLHYR